MQLKSTPEFILILPCLGHQPTEANKTNTKEHNKIVK